jgi:hypothetical protein
VSDALYVHTEECFRAVGAIRTALEPASTFPAVEVPDVGAPAAMESLLTASTLAASLPSAIAAQLGLVANAITLGVIDVYRADSPCGPSPWMTEDD